MHLVQSLSVICGCGLSTDGGFDSAGPRALRGASMNGPSSGAEQSGFGEYCSYWHLKTAVEVELCEIIGTVVSLSYSFCMHN